MCSKHRRRRVFRSSARSGTGACWCPRSPSSAAPRISWRPTSRMGPAPDCMLSFAATRTSRNFGIFAAPDRRLVFSINDFDETLPGPFEWDVKRLAASIAVAGREQRLQRCDLPFGRDGGGARVPRGDGALRGDARTSTSGTRASTSRRSATSLGRGVRQADEALADRTSPTCRRKTACEHSAKLCRSVDGEFRIVGNPPLVTPIEDVLPDAEQEHLEDVVRRMIRTYRRTLPARPAPPAREL